VTHELTHLATGAAATDRVPTWLEEGFADVLGFAGSGIGVRSAAAALLAEVRRNGPPSGPPKDAQLAGAAGALRQAQAYAGGWLLCRMVADRAGTAALVAVYRDTAAGKGTPSSDVDRAMRVRTGRSLAAWVALWRAELSRLAA
jgi:hypothetical protein